MKKTEKYKIVPRDFEKLYLAFNKQEYIHPDPLEFVYRYEKNKDREIVALIASSLAYGNVKQILRSVEKVLAVLGPNPSKYIAHASETGLLEKLRGFKHRWTEARDMVDLLIGIKNVIKSYGSLEACFSANLRESDENVLSALNGFVKELTIAGGKDRLALLPMPERGSACKRLLLFLKWMIRNDEVDVGCWTCASPEKLIVPLDTHMYSICSSLDFTKRKSADLKAAIEVTKAFKRYCPLDPVKYDFALTRLGINPLVDYKKKKK